MYLRAYNVNELQQFILKDVLYKISWAQNMKLLLHYFYNYCRIYVMSAVDTVKFV